MEELMLHSVLQRQLRNTLRDDFIFFFFLLRLFIFYFRRTRIVHCSIALSIVHYSQHEEVVARLLRSIFDNGLGQIVDPMTSHTSQYSS